MNLFVARLNSSTTTKDLHKLFSHYGLVTTVKIIFDHATGQSKCYGFVEMPNNYEAHEALKELDNSSFQENIISVKESMVSEVQNPENQSRDWNRNSIIRTSVNNENHQIKRHSIIVKKTVRDDDNSLRNFGYRGSDYRSFR
jgi:RNA recognition motif-containing protein